MSLWRRGVAPCAVSFPRARGFSCCKEKQLVCEMAYRLPERLYRRCGPEQQHPRRYPPPNSFNLDSSYHTRGGTPSFPLPETRGHHPPSYGDPGFPAREPPLLPPIHLFDNHRSNDGHHWNDDPSLQETGIPLSLPVPLFPSLFFSLFLSRSFSLSLCVWS